MKKLVVKKIAEQIQKIMQIKGMPAKELAKRSHISYSSLMPILNASRDFGVEKLMAIAEGLECNPDALLEGAYSPKSVAKLEKKAPKYLAVFVSIVRITYCRLYVLDTNHFFDCNLPLPLRCGDEVDSFISHIISTIEELSNQIDATIDPEEVAVFASVQQFGRKENREAIQHKGNYWFSHFVLESDAFTNHKVFLGKKNGICVTINTGDIITYSLDRGKTIKSMQGYGFPISDTAGNYWLGCQTIKHVINVQEKQENSSLIFDRLLASYNGDLNLLCTSAVESPLETYLQAASVLKEFIHYDKKANEILKESYELLFADIKLIDQIAKQELPIFVSGELAYLYTELFPQDRLLKIDDQQTITLLDYGVGQLKDIINHES